MSSSNFRPRVSEKAYGLSQSSAVYVFDVPSGMNKQTVAQEISNLYEVKVTKVNILNQNGKAVRSVRRSGRAVNGRRSSYKKAYITLETGQSLPIFVTEDTKSAKDSTKKVAKKGKS